MTSKLYTVFESVITFKSSGGTGLWTPTSVANGAGRMTAQVDRGAGSFARDYNFKAVLKFASALATGNQVYFAIVPGDGTHVAGNLGTVDIALASLPKFNNLNPFACITTDSVTNGELQIKIDSIFIPTRYFAIAVWNASGIAFSSTASDCFMELTPTPLESQ